MFLSNGVQCVKSVGARFFSERSLILIFDWDATMAVESVVHDLEEQGYGYFHQAKGLIPVKDVQKFVGVSFDLLYTPIATYHAMAQQGIAPCSRAELLDQLVKPFLKLHEAIENAVQLHDGALDAIHQLNCDHKDTFKVILTQCPWYLGLARTGITNATRLFDGIVGVRQERPAFLDAFAPEVAYVDQWIMQRLDRVDVSKYKIIAGVPDNLCKPDPLHHRVALGSNPGPNNRVIAFDDKPRRMSAIAAELRKYCPADYAHACVSTWEKPAPEHTISARFTRMQEIPLIVNDLVRSTSVAA